MKAIKQTIMIGLCAFFMGVVNAQEIPKLSYAAYIEKQGWLPAVSEGYAGTVGKKMRMEAFKIEVQSSIAGSITYRAYVQNKNWLSWEENDDFAGTQGQSLAIEAVQIKLTGDLAKQFNVRYRVHITRSGWTEWADNGNVAGAPGVGKQVEAFQVELTPKNTVAVVKPTVNMKGVVTDAATQKPLQASINISDNELGIAVTVLSTDAATGAYQVPLPAGKKYGVAVSAEGYMFYSDNVDAVNIGKAKEIVKDVALSKIEAGVKIVLNNIFFATGKADLSNESLMELERMEELLNENQKVRVEISGHTDNTGSVATNKKLSEARAKAVADYLVSKGIDAGRLVYVGYGSDMPVGSNETVEGRAGNRRTEFKILEN
jgi:outer membrane protein OmpA-like peptidoglycan-associated protein